MKVLPRVLLGLVAVTIVTVLLYWQFGSAKRVLIEPQHYAYFTTNDQTAGGTSTSALSLNGNTAKVDCELNASRYAWPYCGISIHLNPDPQRGLDLSDIHTIRLNVDLQGPAAEPAAMRLYLRNFNPIYSQLDDEYTHKYNGLEFVPGVGKGVIDIPIRSLQVMTWWLVDNRIAIEHSAPEFSNVNKIEFATGSASPLGQYQLTLHQVELIGDYVAGEKLFLAMLIMWAVAGAWLSALEIRRNRREVLRARIRQEHLQRLNYSLHEQNIKFVEMAHRDALTGAINRHGIRDWLQDQARLVRWQLNHVSVLFIDIDYFKQVNDVYGHSLGDDLLREFALVISREIRESDKLVRWGGEEFVVFCAQTTLEQAIEFALVISREIRESDKLVRWGGEEFVVFCAQTTLEQAIELAERLRAKIADHSWKHGGAITCSIGIAQMGDERITETVSRADEALYRAKRLGRNRIEVHYGLMAKSSDGEKG
ncbi:diguanylate cyclase [Vibrio cholerae]|uniref:sensor domain-containing diguanylate cyclase n=4 Tax=Gammaproteobacteria TaxID=1236 RepID=UPI00115896D5|nr:sensor domain-containing diguanylate cyclase [Vibrio cholerae]TQO99951.1 diguanylate cyclase [Vibrio cholerae]TQP09845.1 diguanylate cyclase [Vibrio cholerae]TQP34358.1 diguanylate cyclase [Vibrio cholerae]TQP85333.1 diguanylate cyclase [Vibrio cholerae]